MKYRFFLVVSVIAVSIFVVGGLNTVAVAEEAAQPEEVSPKPSAFFETMAEVLTGDWEGQFTNGTFEKPTTWAPVRVEYTPASNGTALIENYFSSGPEVPNMTTVYFKDNNDLRITHYCGAANHPSMIATNIDPSARTAVFEFTGITNLATPESYHSRQLELKIVDNDHVNITYHGIMNGKIYSQAYALTRVKSSSE